MNSRHQAELAACVQYAAAIFHAERAAVAEAVNEFRQLSLGHGGNQPAHDLFHILGGAPPKARGERMEGKQRGDQLQRVARLQRCE